MIDEKTKLIDTLKMLVSIIPVMMCPVLRKILTFEINLEVTFEGPSWLMKLMDVALAPDNTKNYVETQQVRKNEENSA